MTLREIWEAQIAGKSSMIRTVLEIKGILPAPENLCLSAICTVFTGLTLPQGGAPACFYIRITMVTQHLATKLVL